jgi:phosphopantetheinyl transferase
MIRLVICKNDGGSPSLPPSESSPFTKNGRERSKSDSAHAYLVLKNAYRIFYGEELPKIVKNEKGRPFFCKTVSPNFRENGQAQASFDFQENGQTQASFNFQENGQTQASFNFQKNGQTQASFENPRDFDFNITHTDGLCAVAFLSGEGRIGVDAEYEKKVKNADKIYKRHLKNINKTLHNSLRDVEIFVTELRNNSLEILNTVPVSELDFEKGIVLADGGSLSLSSDGFFTLWTLAEAAVKAEGGGFESLGEVPKILERSHSLSLRYKTADGEWVISLCHHL